MIDEIKKLLKKLGVDATTIRVHQIRRHPIYNYAMAIGEVTTGTTVLTFTLPIHPSMGDRLLNGDAPAKQPSDNGAAATTPTAPATPTGSKK